VTDGNVFDAIADELTGRFTPQPSDNRDEMGPDRTLHSAIRAVFGMHPDHGLTAYYDHRGWAGHSKQVHATLDEVVRQLTGDAHVTAIAWSRAAGRDEEEVVALLAAAAEARPDLACRPRAVPRPLPRSARGSGKTRAAVCGMLAHLAAGTRQPVGECIALVGGDGELAELTGDDLLDRIDQHASAAGLDRELVGDRLLIDRLWQVWELSGVHRAGAYLDRLADGRAWADIDDQTLLNELAATVERGHLEPARSPVA
jgi:hypothetical protein